MIRRLIPLFVACLVVAAFGYTLYYLYQKSKPVPVVYQTALPEVRDIVKKTVATGALVPRKEIAIKPRVSGVIAKLFVVAGDRVKEHALLARIQIIPDVVRVNQADAALRTAQLNQASAKREFERAQSLKADNLMSDVDFARQELSFRLRQEELDTAETNLQLVRVGASKKVSQVSNLVYSTVSGMVLEIPVKEGGSVIEANTFNEGTTIALVADMSDMIFLGRVDESEVGTLKDAMPVSILVGALGEERFEGVLEYIAPKGKEKDGTVEFEVRATVKLKATTFLRANYSANADIILSRRDHALSINEAWVKFEGPKAFVEVETSPQHFEKRAVELGLSDGIWVEVKSGVDARTRIKKPEEGGKSGPPGRK